MAGEPTWEEAVERLVEEDWDRKRSAWSEASLEERNLESIRDGLGWAWEEAELAVQGRAPAGMGRLLLTNFVRRGLGTLWDQLAAHPEKWETPLVEPGFLLQVHYEGGVLGFANLPHPWGMVHVAGARVFGQLTGGVAVILEPDKTWTFVLPEELQQVLSGLPEEEAQSRIEELLEPFTMGLDVGVRPSGTLRIASLLVSVAPLVWVRGEPVARVPMTVALDSREGFQAWSAEERSAVLDALEAALSSAARQNCGDLDQGTLDLLASLSEGETLGFNPPNQPADPPTMTGFTPDPGPVETRTFPLAFQETRLHLDPEVREILGAAHRLRGFPQHWSKVPRWTDLERTRVEELVAGGVERAREAGLLAKQETVNPENGAKIYRLTPRGKRELELEAGTKKSGYRVVQEDGNEYLCRTFPLPSGRGCLEIGFSFHGLAGPWVESWRRELTKEASKAQKELDGLRQKPLLFDELNEEREKDLVRFLEHVRRIDRSQEVLKLILEQVWDQKQNPVMLPAVVFRELLGLHAEAHWKQHVEGVLDFLLGCRMSHRTSTSKEQGRGTLLTHWRYKPAGPGDHAAGDYWLTMNPAFLVSYEVWKTGTVQEDGRTVTLYETGRRLEAEERKALDYQKAFTGHPFVARAAGLTRTQSNLLAWLEDSVTLQGHPARKGFTKARKGSKEAQFPRIYRQDFCPLLPAGEDFVGALSRFKTNPETGRTLFGTRTRGSSKSGAHAAGLLEEMGHLLPPGGAHRRREAVVREALQDLRRVVQGCLGGVVACFDQDGRSWLTLDQAEERSPDQLRRVRFLCFFPPDYRDRLTRAWEERTAQEARQGKRAHAWRATADPQEAERARLALQAGCKEEPRPDPELVQGHRLWTPDMDPLWARLASAQRKRGLSQKELGRLFGVDRSRVARWTKNPSPESGMKGEPVPAYLAPLVLRWVETGEAPTPEELATLDRRNAPAGGVQGGKCAELR